MRRWIVTMIFGLGVLTGCAGSDEADAAAAAASGEVTDTESPNVDVDADSVDTASTTTTTIAADREESTTASSDPLPFADDEDSERIDSAEGLPAACRGVTVDFLTGLEPIVAPVDWVNNGFTLENRTEVFGYFAEFDAANAANSECDLVSLETVGDFQTLLELASEVAPGTIDFLTIAQRDLAVDADPAPQNDSQDQTFQPCHEFLVEVQEIVNQYGSLSQTPANELGTIFQIAENRSACTSEDREYFESPEFLAFLNG